MLKILDQTKRWLREFVEISFLILLALILISLIIGPSAGPFVTSVADNVAKFTAAVTPAGLIGIAIIITIVYLIAPRWR
jgi:hypothetical protein